MMLRNLPCHSHDSNAAWLQVVMTAVDPLAWAKLIAFHGQTDLARCEIAAFRYRVLHVAARITGGARQTYLRIDQTWRFGTRHHRRLARIRPAFT